MSEFRLQRLLAKLFDAFDMPLTPSICASDVKSDMKSNYDFNDSTISELAKSSTNPDRFRSLCEELQFSGLNNELGSILYILNRMNQGHEHSDRKHFESTEDNLLLEPIFYHENRPISPGEQDIELDEISKKLNECNDRIGIVYDAPTANPTSYSSPINIILKKNIAGLSLKTLPQHTTEFAIVEDLLTTLMFSKGNYISFEGQNFEIDDGINPNIFPIIAPILELAKNRFVLQGFLNKCRDESSGKILQALGSTLGSMNLDVDRLIVALDRKFNDEGFLVSQLRFYLEPTISQMKNVVEIVSLISEKNISGGAIIAFLENKLSEYSGNSNFQLLIERLLTSCIKPFLDSLYEWLKYGKLEDPSNEFMIVNNGLDNSELHTFEINQTNLPRTLMNLSQKILLIGIYRRIILRSKQVESDLCLLNRDELNFSRHSMNQLITRIFSMINKSMVSIMDNERGISKVLNRLKGFYFMNDINSMTSYLALCKNELSKPASSVDRNWLDRQAFLIWPEEENNLSCGIASASFFHQLLGIISSTAIQSDMFHLANQYQAINFFTVDFNIPFPMNLVVNQEAISKYQIIFRLRLSILNQVSNMNKKFRFQRKLPQIQKSFELTRLSILYFFQIFQTYLSHDVLEPQYNHLIAQLKLAQGLDRVIALHSNYLDTCLRECLMTNSRLVQILSTIVSISNNFVTLVESIELTEQPELLNTDEIAENFMHLNTQFSKQFRIFLEALQYYSARDSDRYLGSLLAQLDFNSTITGHNNTNAADHFGMIGGLAAA